jgi:hypothetical protein
MIAWKALSCGEITAGRGPGHTLLFLKRALSRLKLLVYRIAVRRDPFPSRPPVSHHVKAVETPETIAIPSKRGNRRSHRFQPRSEVTGTNKPSDFRGPKSRQRFVISVVLAIGRANGRVVVQDSRLHDGKRCLESMVKREVRRHGHMRGMRPCGFWQLSRFPGFHELLQSRLTPQERERVVVIRGFAGISVSRCVRMNIHVVPNILSIYGIMERRTMGVKTFVC